MKRIFWYQNNYHFTHSEDPTLNVLVHRTRSSAGSDSCCKLTRIRSRINTIPDWIQGRMKQSDLWSPPDMIQLWIRHGQSQDGATDPLITQTTQVSYPRFIVHCKFFFCFLVRHCKVHLHIPRLFGAFHYKLIQ